MAREQDFLRRKEEKIAQQRYMQDEKELSECSFTPNTAKSNKNRVQPPRDLYNFLAD